MTTLEQNLAAWLPQQRWFAGKGAGVTGLEVTADAVLAVGDPGLRHLMVAVSQRGAGTPDLLARDGRYPPEGPARATPPPSQGPAGSAPYPPDGRAGGHYQVLAGLRATVPDRLTHAVIGDSGQAQVAYDALHDPDLTHLLLTAITQGREIGPLRCTREAGAAIDTSADSLVLTGEQSNTSVLFGQDAILKFFRRPTPGPNPDLEVPRALARLGSPHVAPPLGWIEGTLEGSPAVFAVLSTYLRAATDGWSLAATSVRDLYASDTPQASQAGGDFAPEARRLGEATAEVHRDLAVAFGTEELPASARTALAEQMSARLDAALASVPELGPHASKLRDAFTELARSQGPLTVQRVHGDFHLGQAMRTQPNWVLLDFDGEPAAPLAWRRARSPVLRDVAGMLRSFEYAARHQFGTHPGDGLVRSAARDWVLRNQDAFCGGYADAAGADPRDNATVLRALTLDKAVYEVMYESRHRPTWLPIPLESIADA